MPSASQASNRPTTPALEIPVPAELVSALEKFLANTHCSKSNAKRLGDEIARVAIRIGHSWQPGTTLRVAGEILKALIEPFNTAAEVNNLGKSLGDTRSRIKDLVNLAACRVLNLSVERLYKPANPGDFFGPD